MDDSASTIVFGDSIVYKSQLFNFFNNFFSLYFGAYVVGGIAFFVTTITPLWCLVLNYLYLLWMALPYQLQTSVLKQQSV